MTLECLGSGYRNLTASQSGQAFDVFHAGVVRLGPDLRDVAPVGGQLRLQEVRNIDVEIWVKLGMVPAKLGLVVAEHGADKRLVRREVRPAGGIDRLIHGFMVLIVRDGGKEEDVRLEAINGEGAVPFHFRDQFPSRQHVHA